jgi:MFS transporter, PHS family, inorganic phosphate transporter
MNSKLATSSQGNKEGFRWRFMITAGVGFFADAYELFIMGVVTAILAPLWHLTLWEKALLNGASLAAAAFGAVAFGILSDLLGRKKLYGYEIAILFIGALLSCTAQSFTWLLIARVIVGLGIGGDYPSSAVVASEHSCPQKRGFTVLLVFAMQAVGLIFGSLLASFFLAIHIYDSVVWRLLLGFGMIPAASVFYLRRTIQESPHYARSKDVPIEASRVVSDLAGVEDDVTRLRYKKQRLFQAKWIKYLIATAGSWFLMDIAFYGNGISTVMILHNLNPTSTVLSHTLVSAAIFLIFALPGYFLAAKYVDSIGRRNLQILGFLAIAVCYAAIGSGEYVTSHFKLFFLLYGLSYFFINFGPNTTTFLIPSEIYPTTIRAKAHGISAAVGKIGAFVGAFFFPVVLAKYDMHTVMLMMSAVSVLGLMVTLLLPEMGRICLSATEDIYQPTGEIASTNDAA